MPNMKIDIQYYIRQVLREQRKVYIPEIGTLILSQTPAYISDDKSVIHPPVVDILFKDGASKDKSLKSYIKETGRYSKSDINDALSEYTQSTFSNLLNNSVNHIEQVGTLSKNEGQDQVHFTPSLESFTKEYKDLTALPIHTVNRIKDSNEVDYVVNTEDQTVRSEGRWRWLQPVVAGILIAGLVILSVVLMKRCNEPDAMLYNNPNETIGAVDETSSEPKSDEFFDKASISEVEDDMKSESYKVLSSKYEEVDELVNSKSLDIDSKIDEELNQLEEETALVVDDSIEDVVSEEAITEADLKDEEAEFITSEDPESKYSAIIPSSGKCIIIVASLKKASNITKMMSQIERQGKEVYTSQYNGMTRIGFVFDCANVDLDAYLNQVRNTFATKAWYLDPSIAIPYK